jgi:hypothetical protein
MSNLSQYLKRSDIRFNTVKNFIKNISEHIPTYDLSQISEVKSTTLDGLLRIHLINEMNTIFYDTNNRYSVESKGNHWEKDFDNAYLEKLSTYRMVQRWMNHPIGLAAEAWVEKQHFECPKCQNHTLVLSGGSNAAWADLHCSSCKDVFIEIKTKWTKALNKIKSKKWMNAGSYRWYKAQEKIGINHYMLIVPKDGGKVCCTKIIKADPTVDNKLCAFYKDAPEHATLRTFLRLNHLFPIGDCTRHEMDELTSLAENVVAQWITFVFGRYANKIKRAYKKYKKI